MMTATNPVTLNLFSWNPTPGEIEKSRNEAAKQYKVMKPQDMTHELDFEKKEIKWFLHDLPIEKWDELFNSDDKNELYKK